MIPNWPIYEKDIAPSVQDAKSAISKIETNKYSVKDLLKLVEANEKILKSIINELYENKN